MHSPLQVAEVAVFEGPQGPGDLDRLLLEAGDPAILALFGGVDDPEIEFGCLVAASNTGTLGNQLCQCLNPP